TIWPWEEKRIPGRGPRCLQGKCPPKLPMYRRLRGTKTRNYLFGRGLRAARSPGETLLAGLEEARKDALEVAQEADAPPETRTEDAAAVSGPFRQRYLAAPRDTTWHGRGAVHSRPRLHLVRAREPLRD